MKISLYNLLLLPLFAIPLLVGVSRSTGQLLGWMDLAIPLTVTPLFCWLCSPKGGGARSSSTRFALLGTIYGMLTGLLFYTSEMGWFVHSYVLMGQGGPGLSGLNGLGFLALHYSMSIGWHAVYGCLSGILIAYIKNGLSRNATSDSMIGEEVDSPRSNWNQDPDVGDRKIPVGKSRQNHSALARLGLVAILIGGALMAVSSLWAGGLMGLGGLPEPFQPIVNLVANLFFGAGIVALSR